MAEFLDTPIEYLKGVGPQKGELLRKELSVFNYGDLLQHYPFRYVDRSRIHRISEIDPDMPYVQLAGRFHSLRMLGDKRSKRLSGTFSDGHGTIEVVWFQGVRWIENSIKTNKDYILFGKPSLFGNRLNIAHPEIEDLAEFRADKISGLQPVYPSTEKLKTRGLDSRGIMKLVQAVFQDPYLDIPEFFPGPLLERFKLAGRKEALKGIHFPGSEAMRSAALFRLKFEELFFTQMRMLLIKGLRKSSLKGYVFDRIGEYFTGFYEHHLPFALTNAQKRVLKEIRADMKNGRQMNRLLQGDVGSGKTIVAFLSMLMALDNKLQACMMAPTEILAQQHYNSISKWASSMDIRTGLLTGSTPSSERKALLADLESGKLQILVGTHALLEESVQFAALGLVIIDEQHRFGVEQRARLWQKGDQVPHVLVMTATPIPRTLAMTVYGDLDVSVIDELPAGRKPITTSHRFESGRLRVTGFIREQVMKGRQAYIVYPLIQESEKLDYQNLVSGFDYIANEFPDHKVCIVHGKLKPDQKERAMNDFKTGKASIMVATSVIEVGVDVPNATLMVIESAEKFGLAQLHQLRGRVGRGGEQSYCILMTGHKLSREARQRMDAMVRTNNGFEIADLDMQLRGPGEIDGLRQSGITNLKLSELGKDTEILRLSRMAAELLLTEDPVLSLPENQAIRSQLKRIYKGTNWSRIS